MSSSVTTGGICTAHNSRTSNAGQVVGPITVDIPGYPRATVYDATNFCPALFAGGDPDARYAIPNLGSYTLYERGATDKPYFTDVRQGGIGDCNMDSLLATAAYKCPLHLKAGIIRDPTSKNNFYVRLFYKTANRPVWVRITASFPLIRRGMEFAYDNCRRDSSGRPIIWPHLYEKAYVCMTNVFPDFLTWGDPNNPTFGYNTLDGVDGVVAQQAIIGIRPKTDGSPDSTWFGQGNCYEIAKINEAKQKFDNLVSFINTPLYICTVYLSYGHIQNTSPPCVAGQDTSRNGRYIFSPDTMCVYVYGPQRTLEHVFVPYHAYSLWRINTVNGVRFAKLRNPWGNVTLDDAPIAARENRPVQRITYKYGVMNVKYEDFVYCFNILYSIRPSANVEPVSSDPLIN